MIARVLSLGVIAYLWAQLIFKIGVVVECTPLTATQVIAAVVMFVGIWYLGYASGREASRG